MTEGMKFFEKMLEKSSHKLLFTYSKKTNHFGLDILCLKCLGIVIDPYICKSCNGQFCTNCFNQIKKEKLYCLCSNPQIENFELKPNPILEKSSYTLERITDQKPTKIEVPYTTVLKSIQDFKIGYDSKSKSMEYFYDEEAEFEEKDFDKEEEHVRLVKKGKYLFYENMMNHSKKCSAKFPFKIILMMKFVKHRSLSLKCKYLCGNDALKLATFNLKKLSLMKCKINFDYAILFGQGLSHNHTTLETFNFSTNTLYLKELCILYKSLSLCKNLRNLYLEISDFYKFEKYLISFFCQFINPMQQLINLKLPLHYFDQDFDFTIFRNLNALRSIDLSKISISDKAFSNIFQELGKLKNLTKMNFEETSLSHSWDIQNIDDYPKESLEIIKLNANPEYLKLGSLDGPNLMIEIFFKVLISSKTIKRVSIYFDKINDNMAKEICNYISNSKILKEFRFTIKDSSFNNRIINSLIVNSTIEKLSLKNTDLSKDYKFMDTLIKENQSIKILNLTHCGIYSGSYLGSSLAKNVNLQKIILLKNKISETVVRELLNTSKEIIIEKSLIDKVKKDESIEKERKEKFLKKSNKKEEKSVKAFPFKKITKK